MLSNILVSEVRVNILKLLLLNPKRSYHVRAIVRAVGAEINAVRRELENLFQIELVTRRQSSNRIYYQINTEHPYYSDLLSLVSKEEGIGAAILKKGTTFEQIEFAALALEFLRGRKSTALDVDVFLVGSIKMDDLKNIIQGEEEKLGREINFSVMSSEEFTNRKRTNDQFVMRFLTQGRTMLIGDDKIFCAIV